MSRVLSARASTAGLCCVYTHGKEVRLFFLCPVGLKILDPSTLKHSFFSLLTVI